MVPSLAYWKGIGPHDSDGMWAMWVESKITIAQMVLYFLAFLCLLWTLWDYRHFYHFHIEVDLSIWVILSLIFSFLLSRVVTTLAT